MPASARMFGKATETLLKGEWNWKSTGGSAIKVMLLTNVQAQALTDGSAQDTWVYKDKITSEVSTTGTNYTPQTLTNKTFLAYELPTNTTAADADDVTWSNSNITARFAVVYADTGTPSTSPLIGFVDFGSDKSSSNGDFKLIWDVAGIFGIAST